MEPVDNVEIEQNLSREDFKRLPQWLKERAAFLDEQWFRSDPSPQKA